MRILASICAIVLIGAAVVAAFFFGGFYNVAASEEDAGIVSWALVHIREASIQRRVVGTPPMKLDDPATIREGGRKFAEHGCTNCHGAPGVEWAKFSEGLNPGPPDLKDVANEDEPARIFWVVKNGIRMTGMPSFGKAGMSDNDIWEVVAFVKKLPTVSEADFKAWTASQPPPATAPSAPAAPTPPGSNQ
jgi:mono/diheme cytochrome c family protein